MTKAIDACIVDVLAEQGELHGVPLRHAVSRRMGKDVAVGAVYAACDRLEEAGVVASREGEATAERGWRRKRYFRLKGEGA